jgi:hypothetical protein
MHMPLKPVILDGIVLGARCHTLGFQTSKGKGTPIILMDFDVHVSGCIDFQTNGRAELRDHVHNGKEILA